MMSDSKTVENKITEQPNIDLNKRIPVHKQNIYDYASYRLDLKNFAYRWANPENLESYYLAGWSHHSDLKGNFIRRGRGKGEQGDQYMLKKPRAMFEADQKDEVADTHATLSEIGIKDMHGEYYDEKHIYRSKDFQTQHKVVVK